MASVVYGHTGVRRRIMPKNVAILLFDEVEVLDSAGPFEIFSVTGLRGGGGRPFNVRTVAEKPGAIIARNNLVVQPRYTIENCVCTGALVLAVAGPARYIEYEWQPEPRSGTDLES
jgi:hypothetical protein